MRSRRTTWSSSTRASSDRDREVVRRRACWRRCTAASATAGQSPPRTTHSARAKLPERGVHDARGEARQRSRDGDQDREQRRSARRSRSSPGRAGLGAGAWLIRLPGSVLRNYTCLRPKNPNFVPPNALVPGIAHERAAGATLVGADEALDEHRPGRGRRAGSRRRSARRRPIRRRRRPSSPGTTNSARQHDRDERRLPQRRRLAGEPVRRGDRLRAGERAPHEQRPEHGDEDRDEDKLADRAERAIGCRVDERQHERAAQRSGAREDGALDAQALGGRSVVSSRARYGVRRRGGAWVSAGGTTLVPRDRGTRRCCARRR